MTRVTGATADRVWHSAILGEPATLLLVRTCFACPEQYDVFTPDGTRVAYLRLRHGWFSASMPDSAGVDVYHAEPEGDGIFADEDERDRYLDEACEAIARHVRLARRLAGEGGRS